jgi:hypothetical protein
MTRTFVRRRRRLGEAKRHGDNPPARQHQVLRRRPVDAGLAAGNGGILKSLKFPVNPDSGDPYS